MRLPRFDEMFLPILQELKKTQSSKARDLEEILAKKYNLDDKSRNLMYDSGNGPIFLDRIQWALSYLNMAGLIEKPQRGMNSINKSGIKMLSKPENIKDFVKSEIKKRNPVIKASDEHTDTPNNEELTPEESLYEHYNKITDIIYNEIIKTILSKSPRDFENLVVNLMQKMGYGGGIRDSGTTTSYTNDKGIDGIVKEDVLGFGSIYLQAKRYAENNLVGREEVQKFVGALAPAKSNKGVFITTSKFASTALKYVDSLDSSIHVVLIDGRELAKYIYEYDLGMQTEKILKIKKLDSDFWDQMKDD